MWKYLYVFTIAWSNPLMAKIYSWFPSWFVLLGLCVDSSRIVSSCESLGPETFPCLIDLCFINGNNTFTSFFKTASIVSNSFAYRCWRCPGIKRVDWSKIIDLNSLYLQGGLWPTIFRFWSTWAPASERTTLLSFQSSGMTPKSGWNYHCTTVL